MKIDFWTPYFGNVGTIKATINSADAIKKYSKDRIDINLIKIHSEWEGYENIISSKNINIINFNLKKYVKKLPKHNFLYRISMLLIMFYSIPKLINHFNKNKTDVVIASLQGVTPLIARLMSFHKPKIILSIQGLPSFLATKEVYNTYPFYKKIESKLRVYIWKSLYTKADKIVALTQKTRDDLIKVLDCDNEKVIYIPNPVIDDEINTKSLEDLDDDFFLKNDVLLGIGRLTKQKDFITLIKAFSIIKKVKKKLKLVILGEGEEKGDIEDLILSLNLENEILLYGFVSNPYKYLRKSKLLILSSLWEDPGHVLMEAAYLNISIVATNCPNDVDIFLSKGKAGHLCEIGNEIDMANKIIMSLKNDNTNKIKLAHTNSLSFTSKVFFEQIIKLCK